MSATQYHKSSQMTPSDSDSPPDQSSAPSSSDSGPPETPRGRHVRRYPSALGPGHVPLHRRGTSRTYERLEDLLREAGYKETRIFTPETERADAGGPEVRIKSSGHPEAHSAKGSMRAVVGFLAGLVSRSSSIPPGKENDKPQPPTITYSPPASPLANKRPLFTSSPSELSAASSLDVEHPSHRRPPPRPSANLVRPLSSSTSAKTYSEAGQARVYLRHMASAPTALASKSTRHSSDDAPALPSSWLDTVAKAVLYGGAGAHIGRPASTTKQHSPKSQLRHSRSTRAYTGTRPRPAGRVPRARSATPSDRLLSRPSAGIMPSVSHTSVTCCSAPGSRAGSPVRRVGSFNSGRRKRPERPPVLARTQTQGDEWHPEHERDEALADDDEDEDAELDLARMLVPPKRAQSIRSLRRHLPKHPPHGQRRRSTLTTSEEGEEEAWFRGRRTGTEEEDARALDALFERDAHGKGRRGGLPGAWMGGLLQGS